MVAEHVDSIRILAVESDVGMQLFIDEGRLEITLLGPESIVIRVRMDARN